MHPRSVLVLCAVLLAIAPAVRADVVILEGNEVPLSGEIIFEDETSIGFRIRGLTDGAHLVIEKSRIRKFWREEGVPSTGAGSEPPGEAAPPAPAVRPAPAAARKDVFDRALDRLMIFVPSDPGLRVLGWLAGFGALSLLFHLGGWVTELEKMRLGRGAILALVTQFLVLLGVLAYQSVSEPMTFPLLFGGLVVAWIMVARMLTGDRVSKSVLLLSFTVASLLVVTGTVFSVLTVA